MEIYNHPNQFKTKNVAFTRSLIMIIGLTEGVSLILLVPLLQLVGPDVQQRALGGISVYISSFFSYFGIKPTLAFVLMIYIRVISLNAYFSRLQTTLSVMVLYQFAVHLRKKLFNAITI